MKFSPLIERLIDSLRCLPGVGPKTAQRMAFQLLERNRDNALHLSTVLREAVQMIRRCEICRTLTETEICRLCAAPNRDASVLCVVESPMDMAVVEQMGGFRGRYFVLMGHLSPLDGIGPDDIGLNQLDQLLKQNTIQEVILATNSTVEGEATAHYISNIVRQYNIKVSRIAHGVPLGGELEYIDSGTLARAFAARGEI
ncbi:MAG: recombination mediator RecR [Gammaproteobacteria bacterium]|nr:recombination mediator RecR [Gammaproteobacteria bacterium]